jgi:urease gamma subunit
MYDYLITTKHTAIMSKKQTAVDWLVSQLQKTRNYQRVINEANASGSSVMDVIEQAKAMEKEQIVNAHLTGLIHPLEIEATKQAEQYYNETYGGDK